MSAADGRAAPDALRRAIATRRHGLLSPLRRGPHGHDRGYDFWDVDHAGWVVTLHSPEEQTF